MTFVLPTMTKGKHWLGLFALITAEATLAFAFFAYTSAPILGLILVVLGNVEFIGAIVLALMNTGKKSN